MFEYIALNSAFFALCVCVLLYLVMEKYWLPVDVRYFKPGSHREMLLIIAIREYIVVYAPTLCCDCEFIVEHEKMLTDNKKRFEVSIRFKHDATCGMAGEKAKYLVDVSDSLEIQIVSPLNEDEIKSYKV